MPARCCVSGCGNIRKKSSGEQYSFHVFPSRDKSPKRFKSWKCNINRKNFMPTKHSVICSKHFKEDDYELTTLLKQQLMPNSKFLKILKKTAIPSLLLQAKPECLMQKRSLTSKRKKLVREAISSTTLGQAKLSKPKEKEIQCELGREILRKLQNTSETQDSTYEANTIFKMPEGEYAAHENIDKSNRKVSFKGNDVIKWEIDVCKPSYEKTELIEEYSQANSPEAVFIRTEIDDDFENENFQLYDECFKKETQCELGREILGELQNTSDTDKGDKIFIMSQGEYTAHEDVVDKSTRKVSIKDNDVIKREIDVCKPSYEKTELIEEHSQENSPEEVFVKTEIDEDFENEHFQLYDEYIKKEYFGDCLNITINTSDTDHTTETNQEEVSKAHKCLDCDKTFTTASLLERHHRVHSAQQSQQPYEGPTLCRAFKQAECARV